MTDKIDPIVDRFEASFDGLDDHSEELSERTEEDAQIRFYRAMADSEMNYSRLLSRLTRVVATMIFDLCVIYLCDDDQGQGLRCAAAYHPHRPTLEKLNRHFINADGLSSLLVQRVISQRESYFRPRWRPNLLQAYSPKEEFSEEIPIHSLLAVPLITSSGRCLGALLVGRHTTSLSYDEADLALTQWIASHAAMKLETAQLYRDLYETNKQLDQAVQERNTFISIAAHELRTPLSALKLHAQMLERTALRSPQDFSADDVLPKLRSIDRQVDRLDNLIDQLLNVSRIIDGGLNPRPTRCDLAALLYEVARRFAYEIESSGSTLTITCEGPLIGMWDQEKLDHVATNLLSNAIKYGAGNPIAITARSQDQMVLFSVSDNGTGITPEAQDRIFERFERAVDHRHAKGLGLGLWIVREYIQSMNGEIYLESTPGQGTTFTVRLPWSLPSS